MFIFLTIVAIVVTIGAGVLMTKKLNPALVLLFAGLILLAVSLICNPDLQVLNEKQTTGSQWLDILKVFESVASSQLTGVGLVIMATGGFSTYMNKIGATRALVSLSAKPISKIKHKYVLLVVAYFIGVFLAIFIPSAAGLAMLLIVLLLPILTAAGISPGASAAVLATVSAVPLTPAAGTTVLGASIIGISPVMYFAQYQFPVGIPTIIAIAITQYFVQKHFDKVAPEKVKKTDFEVSDDEVIAPKWYSLFLMLPIVLLIVLSPLMNTGIEISTMTAFVAVWVLAMIVEAIKKHSINLAFENGKAMFQGMGRMLSGVVVLIICAQLFAQGITATGIIDSVISGAEGLGWGMLPMAIIFTLIVGLVTFLTGSGVASFTAFSSLSPDIAAGVGGKTAALVLPMQCASGLARAMSPIAGVVIAVAGGTGLTPLQVVKRTAIPMCVGYLVMMISSAIVVGF